MIKTIKQQRLDAGLSQLQLSMKSGVPQGSISAVENAGRHFSKNEAAKIAPHLGTTPDDLVEVSQVQVVLKSAADLAVGAEDLTTGEPYDLFIESAESLGKLGSTSPWPLVRKAARLSLRMINSAVKEAAEGAEGSIATKEVATKDASDPDVGFGGRDPLGRRLGPPVPGSRNDMGFRRSDEKFDRDGFGRRKEKDVPDRDAFGKRPGPEPPDRDAAGRAIAKQEVKRNGK
jgi:transcriptional regulator with XRE-family HTH domain